MFYKVSFQYNEYVFCTNIAEAENMQDVENEYSKYEWYSIKEATAYDVKEAKEKGMPIVKCERKEKEPETMKKENMINLETLKDEVREEIGTDATYLAADYHECNTAIDEAIQERADSETSIYYSDIIKFISENVEEVNDTIKEFGWNGVGQDLYKAGQLTEYLQIESKYRENVEGIIKYAAIMTMIYDMKLSEVPADKWEEIEGQLAELDEGSRFDNITDIINEVLTAETEDEESAGVLDMVRNTMIEGFNSIANKAGQAINTDPTPESVTA